MRRLLGFAFFFAFGCTISAFATIPIGVLCPLQTSNGSPIVVNYGPYFINSVSITGNGAQLTNVACNFASGGSYATFDITAPNGFSLVFGDILDRGNNPVSISNIAATSQTTINGVDFYSTTFTASDSIFGTDPNQFLGVGIVGGKSGASWSGTSSELDFDPAGGTYSAVLYELPSVPGSLPPLPSVPEPSTLLLLAGGMGALASRSQLRAR